MGLLKLCDQDSPELPPSSPDSPCLPLSPLSIISGLRLSPSSSRFLSLPISLSTSYRSFNAMTLNPSSSAKEKSDK